MLELLKPFWMIILKWGGIAAGVLLVLFKARQSGKEAEQRKTAMDILKGAQTSAKIENDIAGASDAERKRLRSKWNRD